MTLPRGPNFLVAVLLMGTVAGCMDGGERENGTSSSTPADVEFVAGGDDSTYAGGYNYDGKSDWPVVCAILITTNDAKNTGAVTFHLDREELDQFRWEIFMQDFAAGPGESYKDGGIASNFEAFGNTGIGGTDLPRMKIESAGWGEARLEMGGQQIPDPVTNDPLWVAEYRVVNTGIRDNATGGIWNSARTAPFSPQTPGDGAGTPGDKEVHFVLKTHGPPPQATSAVSVPEQTANSESYNRHFPILADNRFPGANVSFSVTARGAPANTNLVFAVKDARGDIVSQARFLGGVDVVLPLSFNATKLGPYRLNVTGLARTDVTFSGEGTYTPPKEVVLNFWWDAVSYGQTARYIFEAKQHPR